MSAVTVLEELGQPAQAICERRPCGGQPGSSSTGAPLGEGSGRDIRKAGDGRTAVVPSRAPFAERRVAGLPGFPLSRRSEAGPRPISPLVNNYDRPSQHASSGMRCEGQMEEL